MSWLSFIPTIFKGIKWLAGGVTSYINQKRTFESRERAAEHNLKLAKLNAKITKAAKEGQWEVEAVKTSGWRADALFMIVMMPLVLCFVPGAVQYVHGGFRALTAVIPDWWLAMVGATTATTYGLRAFAGKKWRKTK